MIDLGTVRPGSTIRIPFSSFDKDDGSSITMTNFAAADVLIYKDGGTTDRGTGGGITATTDFDGKTGKHLAIIDLADDATTADFFKAGSEYLVAIDTVTVDGVTTGGWVARFRIGYPNAYFDTSIATLASQTSFTLTVGPAEDDALNGMVLLVHDKASAIQVTRVVVEDYTGSTKTVTLRAAPATTFTIAAGDNVSAVGFDKVDVSHVSGTAVTWSATRGLAGTALPAAAAGAANGVPVSTAGSLDLDTLLGRLDAAITTRAAASVLGAAVGASISADIAAVKTDTGNLVTRITANLFAGITKMAEWLGLIAGKQTGDATARTEIRATGAGSGTYDETTDSAQALRDRGDAAWTTATGFSTHSAADVWAAATRTLTANTNFNDPTAATIAAAVVGETMTELAAIPSASPTLKQAVALLYMALRNKVTVSATAKVIHNDAGTALGTKALSDDGTTYTEAEIA